MFIFLQHPKYEIAWPSIQVFLLKPEITTNDIQLMCFNDGAHLMFSPLNNFWQQIDIEY